MTSSVPPRSLVFKHFAKQKKEEFFDLFKFLFKVFAIFFMLIFLLWFNQEYVEGPLNRFACGASFMENNCRSVKWLEGSSVRIILTELFLVAGFWLILKWLFSNWKLAKENAAVEWCSLQKKNKKAKVTK